MKKTLFMLLAVLLVMMFADSRYAPFLVPFVFAHCDTLDGPVVKTARAALEKGDVTPVLKWVGKEDEAEITDLFKKTLTVRTKGKDAREIADRYFFETLVRVHRAGEGAPYTGLKPAGTVEPAVAEADRALESGSADKLVKLVTDASSDGIRRLFSKTVEAKKHADHNVEAGRAYVESYIQFTHYVERLHEDAVTVPGHGHGAPSPEAGHQH